MTKFFNKLKNPVLVLFGPFSQFLGQKIFIQKIQLSHKTSHSFLAPCQNLEKTKKIPRQTEGQMEGWKNKRTDRPYFTGPFCLPPGLQLMVQNIVFIIMHLKLITLNVVIANQLFASSFCVICVLHRNYWLSANWALEMISFISKNKHFLSKIQNVFGMKAVSIVKSVVDYLIVQQFPGVRESTL